jgi:hypothetical protein
MRCSYVILCVAHLPLAAALAAAAPPRLVILGPGSPDVQLIAAKKAASDHGYKATAIVRDAKRAMNLMYGSSMPSKGGDGEVAVAAEGNSDIGRALSEADTCLLVAEAGGETGIKSTLKYAPGLTRLVLLSSIGGSKGKGGMTYLGEGEAILKMEKEVIESCAAASVEVSIVRVGVLKGGGPPFGLDASYYDTLRIGGYPTPNFACAQAYDLQTLGVSVTAGDGLEPRSAIARSGSKVDTGPKHDECSRIVAAEAMLACLRQPKPTHVSLSAESATAPPSAAEWDELLRAVARE